MKKLIMLILVVGLMFSMAACGTPAEKASDANVDNQQGAASEGDGGEQGLTGELVYWSMWNNTEPQALVLQEAIDDFMAKNPGVKVEINWNGREIRQTLQPALDSGQKIDIWDEDLERVIKTWGGYALNLDDYYTKAYPTTEGTPYIDSVLASTVDAAKEIAVIAKEDGVELSDGELFAVPYQPYSLVFMYNKEHFEQAGIASAPETWAEFMDACEKLKVAGFEPITTDDFYLDLLLGNHLARLKGYEWVEDLVKGEGDVSWDDPAVLATAKAYEEMASKGYFSKNIASNKWPAGQQDIAAGTVSMYMNGTWLVNEIMGVTGEDFAWGQFVYPMLEGGKTDYAATFGGQAFQINKNCDNPDAAFALIVHLTTGEWDKTLAETSYGVPVGGTTEWPVQLQDAKEIFNNMEVRYPWGGGIQANPDKTPVIAEQFTLLIGGSITAEEFVQNLK